MTLLLLLAYDAPAPAAPGALGVVPSNGYSRVGNAVRFDARLIDEAGAAVDSLVTFTVRRRGDAKVTLSGERLAAGHFQALFTWPQDGLWLVRARATDPVAVVTREAFYVAPDDVG